MPRPRDRRNLSSGICQEGAAAGAPAVVELGRGVATYTIRLGCRIREGEQRHDDCYQAFIRSRSALIHINRLVDRAAAVAVYTFPPLNDCRGQFADMMQQNIKWDGPEDTRQMRGRRACNWLR